MRRLKTEELTTKFVETDELIFMPTGRGGPWGKGMRTEFGVLAEASLLTPFTHVSVDIGFSIVWFNVPLDTLSHFIDYLPNQSLGWY